MSSGLVQLDLPSTPGNRTPLVRTSLESGRRGLCRTALSLGLLGLIVTMIGSWIPSFWGDEAASIMSAERPVSTLWRELGRVDAVHGTYYLFLHFWIDLFGASEFSVRLPSAIAVGIAVAGTVVLADLLFTRRTAVFAGLVFILLPRVDYMGAEARSYAMGTAIAVWATVVLVILLRRRTSRVLPWLAYGALFAVAIYVFLYLALLAIVHAVVVLAMPKPRALLRRWMLAMTATVLLAIPVLAYGLFQHNQISFLAKRNYATFNAVGITQWFGSVWLAVPAWALLAFGVVMAFRSRREQPAERRKVPNAPLLVAAWIALPTLILFAGNTFVAPMYSVRYLSFCTPVVAIAIGLGIVALGRIRPDWMPRPSRFVGLVLPVTALVVLVALATPTDVFQRTAYAKDAGSDLRQLSEVVAANAASGDAIVFDNHVRPSRKSRLAIHLYPQDFTGLVDVALHTPYTRVSGLWDTTYPIAALGPRLADIHTVWDVESNPIDPVTKTWGDIETTPANILAFQRLGYTVIRTIPVHRTTVYELTKETP